MKKFSSCILVFSLILSMFFVPGVYAADAENGIEQGTGGGAATAETPIDGTQGDNVQGDNEEEKKEEGEKEEGEKEEESNKETDNTQTDTPEESDPTGGTTEDKPTHQHNYTIITESNKLGNGSCIGFIVKCENCEKTVEADTHFWVLDQDKTKEATCTESGSKTYKCSKCDTEKTLTIPAVSHEASDWIVDKESTCTEEGAKHKECTVCHEVLETATIAKNEHTWTEATCASPKTCSTCGATEGEALGHTWDIEHATRENPATCSKCGEKEEQHNWTSKVTKMATCTVAGVKKYTCSICSFSYTEKIPATGHTWSNATCTSPKTCSTCGATNGKELGHDYGEPNWKWSGGTATATFACKHKGCNDVKTENAEVTSETVKATLSKDGSKTYNAKVTFNKADYQTTKSTKIYKISSVALSATSYAYNGKVKTPSVTVKDSKGNTLKKGTDYTVSYSSGRTNIGTYNVKVTFKGNYSGSKTLAFKIIPGKVTNLKNSGRTLSWSKVAGAESYQVYIYNTSTQKWTKCATTSKTSYTIPKKYHCGNFKVRVRAVSGDFNGALAELSFKVSHKWDSHSEKCLQCDAQDTVVKYTGVTMSPNRYKVNEAYKSTLTFSIQGKYHNYTMSTTKKPSSFTTKTPGKKTITFNKYNGVTCSYTVTK